MATPSSPDMKLKYFLFALFFTVAIDASAQTWNGTNVNATGSVTANANVNAFGWVQGHAYVYSPNYVQAGGALYAGTTITAGSTITGAGIQGNSWLYSPGYLSITGASYLGSYSGSYALTVSNTDGSVVMKKAQGDIAMGQFGN